MNLMAGGLFTGVFYRWPVLILAGLLLVAGYVFGHADQFLADGNEPKTIQGWSPTAARYVPLENHVFGVLPAGTEKNFSGNLKSGDIRAAS